MFENFWHIITGLSSLIMNMGQYTGEFIDGLTSIPMWIAPTGAIGSFFPESITAFLLTAAISAVAVRIIINLF